MKSLVLFLFSHRVLTSALWDWYFLKLRLINRLRLKRLKIRAWLRTINEARYLNLSSGPRGVSDKHWLNIDLFRYRNVHFLLDFCRGLPIDNNTFDGVFYEHVLEHFSLEDGSRLSSEILRVLKPSGVFRVVVPNAEHLVRSFLEDLTALVLYRTDDANSVTLLEMVNSFFRHRYEHKFLYDFDSIQKILLGVGFQYVERSSVGHARFCTEIALDDKKYFWQSLYIEAK